MAGETTRPKLGLALSGGGFRATAFHLGVLKRLRELGLLKQIATISTVSGGTILGAYWVYRQSLADTLDNDEEWDSFEQSIIQVMRQGLRWQLIFRTLSVPFVIFALIVTIPAALDSWPIAPVAWLAVTIPGSVIALYFTWTLTAGDRLRQLYERRLFNGASVKDLTAPLREKKVPELLINATSLTEGRPVVFTPVGRMGATFASLLSRSLGPAYAAITRRMTLPRQVSRVTLGAATAASSAVPGFFPPVPIPQLGSPGKSTLIQRIGGKFSKLLRANYVAVDGGVFDNQGVDALLFAGCERIIVSDASATLKKVGHPPVFPLPVLRRSQDIIFSRVRELGFNDLLAMRDKYELLEVIRQSNIDEARVAKVKEIIRPLVESFCKIELAYEPGSDADSDLRHLRFLRNCLARVRTDLDMFSEKEISGLMFFGYSLTDELIREAHADWVSEAAAKPAAFSSAVEPLNMDWKDLSSEEHKARMAHLAASASRSILIRWYKRARRLT